MTRTYSHFLLAATIFTIVNLAIQLRYVPLDVGPLEGLAGSLRVRNKVAGVVKDKTHANSLVPAEEAPSWVKALHVPESILQATNVSLIPIDDIPVSLIGIMTMGRSSSTFLTSHVLKPIPCHLTLSEIFGNNPIMSEDTWPVDGAFLGLDPVPERNSPAQLAHFVLRAAKRKCREYLEQSGHERRRMCANHCWVNWKEFLDRVHGDYEFHAQIWKLLLPYDLRMVVLERPVKDRWPSHWYGEQTGDWHVMGGKSHKQDLAAAKVPEMPSSFRDAHEGWYSFVRSFLSTHTDFLWMELSFDDITKQDLNLTQQMLVDFISTPKPPANALSAAGLFGGVVVVGMVIVGFLPRRQCRELRMARHTF